MKRIPLEKPDPADRRTRFAELNKFVTERNGWITSLPGDAEVRLETLQGSTLPEALRSLGYDVIDTGEVGERILHCAIEQRFGTGIDGVLEPLTMGSTRAVALTMKHAGIVPVMRFALMMP